MKLELTENARKLLESRYQQKNNKGEIIETAEEVFKRVAKFVANGTKNTEIAPPDESNEYWEKMFLEELTSLRFLPNSPTIMNAGARLGQLSACFVLPIEDSLVSIMDTLTLTALIHQSGGGTGFDFSRLRPRNDVVKSTGGIASGPVSFMKLFDAATETVKQGGCFTGDTLIATLEGNIPIKDLVGRMTYVYSYDLENCKMTVGKTVGSWKTYSNMNVYELKTDKGLIVRCTENHPFLLRNKKYRKLQELKIGDSLMPLTRYMKLHHSKNEIFITLQDGHDTRMPEHHFVYTSLYGSVPKDHVIHHKDRDHYNNYPTNLELLLANEHSTLHGKENSFFKENHFHHTGKQNGMHKENKFWRESSPEEIMTYRYKIGKAFRDKNPMKDVAGNTNHQKNKLINKAFELISLGFDVATSVDEYIRYFKEVKNYDKWTINQRLKTIDKYFNSYETFKKVLLSRNHKVVSIRPVGKEDVYNLEVEKYHNFAVVSEGDYSTGVIVSNTRRGANMASLRIDHPDIMEFINCKKQEGVLGNMNISVAITDEFMEALKKGLSEKPYESGWQYPLKNPRSGEIVDQLSALEVFKDIVEHAWQNGEPGVFFIDRINKFHPEEVGKIEGTNPSLAIGTLVLTDKGIIPIEKLQDTTFKVITIEGKTAPAKCFLSGEQEQLYEITLENKIKYYTTKEHKWPVLSKTEYKKIKGKSIRLPTTSYKKTTTELKEGDRIPLVSIDNLGYGTDFTYSDGFITGYFYSDGSLSYKDEKPVYNFTFSQDAIDGGLFDIIRNKLTEITGGTYDPKYRNSKFTKQSWKEITTSNRKLIDYLHKIGVNKKDKGIPSCIWSNASESFRKGFIDGLFSTDGSISETKLVLTSSRKKLIDDVSTLLSFYGIKNSVSQRKNMKNITFPNGKEYGKDYTCFDLKIHINSAILFREIFTISDPNKNEKLQNLKSKRKVINSNSQTIISVTKTDRFEKVWDVAVFDDTHTFKLAYCITGNCGGMFASV